MPRVTEVQQAPDRYLNSVVRWGGEVIKVRNEKEFTDIEVLARTLESGGKPKSDGQMDARFIARIGGFVEPAEYSEGARLTVRGQVIGQETRRVGEYPYPYPVVQVISHHRWPPPKPEVRYVYDPFYDPWWPHRYWHRYPYWW